MSLYVYHQSEFVPARRYIDNAFATNAATCRLVAALTADIVKVLNDDALRLRFPAAPTFEELELVWKVDGESAGAIALIDETLKKPEASLTAAKAARLKEIRRVAEIAQHFLLAYVPEDAAPQIGVSGAPATQPVNPGTLVMDVFTLTNLSNQPGTFSLDPAQIMGPNGAIAPAGYVVPAAWPPPQQQPYSSIQSLDVAAGGSQEVGVTYVVPDADVGQLVFCSLGATFSAFGQTSEPQAALVWDAVVPAPSATATKPAKQTVAPATTCTDAFGLTNTSGQAATFSFAVDLQLTDAKKNPIRDVPAGHFTEFGATRQSDAAKITAHSLSDFNRQLAGFPVDDGDTVAITVSYRVPDGAKGDFLIDTVIVNAIAGNSVSTPVQTVTATNVLGSAIDVLGQIVAELNATYHLKTLPATVPARLQQVNEEIRDFVNDGSPIVPKTHDFAHALAVHDLVDALYGRLIGDDRPAPRIDEVP